MLILTRKLDQSIVIDDNIVIRVLAIDRDRVKIGISAPRSVGVLRGELVKDESKGYTQSGAGKKTE